MARGSADGVSLAKVRRLLRDVRNASGEQPGALSSAVEIALYRLPKRQREILRRYDLEGESADVVQTALGLSQRQFYRDRRAGLAALHGRLFGSLSAPAVEATDIPAELSPAAGITVRETQIAQRALARNLWHSGSVECLRVLRELAHGVTKPATRVELLLDLAEAAGDYDEDETVIDATNAAEQLADEVLGASASDRAAFLLGRIAHARGRRDASISDTAAHFDQAVSLLRRSLREDPSSLETRSVLADALNNTAALHYYKGDIPEARRVVSEASSLIEAFSLASRPKALETLAGKAILDAFFGGRTSDAIELIASLLLRAIDSGWCSTAIMLGAYLVGLNSVRGDYEEAIRWHDRISSSVLDGARPNDRALLAIQAAHAYTMSGRAQQALSLLAYVKPGAGCPPWEAPYWHTEAGAALERLDQNTAALAEARKALDGYDALGAHRGKGSAHRIMAICYAKLGNGRAAREHIAEAALLTERFGNPYQLLSTLIAKADILADKTLHAEAIEFARLLRNLS